jgi:hypothetical protein
MIPVFETASQIPVDVVGLSSLYDRFWLLMSLLLSFSFFLELTLGCLGPVLDSLDGFQPLQEVLFVIT